MKLKLNTSKQSSLELVEVRLYILGPVEIRISLRFDKKYFARYHFRFVIFSLFYLVQFKNA